MGAADKVLILKEATLISRSLSYILDQLRYGLYVGEGKKLKQRVASTTQKNAYKVLVVRLWDGKSLYTRHWEYTSYDFDYLQSIGL